MYSNHFIVSFIEENKPDRARHGTCLRRPQSTGCIEVCYASYLVNIENSPIAIVSLLSIKKSCADPRVQFQQLLAEID
jgi:hypothetical protein